MMYRTAPLARFVCRPFFFAAALVCLFTFAPDKPAFAQGYEGLVESQGGYSPPRRGNQNTDGGGYQGLVGWDSRQSATNPYGSAPAGDIYQFVRGSGGTVDERRAAEKENREAQRRARQQQILDTNRARAEALHAQLQAENEARQRQNQAQHAEIMQRLQQQQQQQQQQQRR
ncbi:MAG: hypothetical protein Q8K65_06125 [Alphaproteobacteria bacterium]|nr:hypothetical protein [Alphaproteobacteria bacterium]